MYLDSFIFLLNQLQKTPEICQEVKFKTQFEFCIRSQPTRDNDGNRH